MGTTTTIAWTDHTFNPWVGCQRVSEGCRHCYAETLMVDRFKKPVWGPTAIRERTGKKLWAKPVAWNRAAEAKGLRARVFCGSLCDIFEDHPDANAIRPEVFALIRGTPWLDWQLLTKRPENIARMLPADWGEGYPNVWLGTSIESMAVACRAPILAAVPAAVRFISYEPALGPLDELPLEGIHWVIYGGESGPGYRAQDPAWARTMRDRCAAAGVAFFYKQANGLRPGGEEELLDGTLYHAWPRDR